MNALRPALLLLLVLAGCVTPPDHSAYRPYLDHMPRSILVLPPINHSANVRASDAFLSTISRPLAECGYYVFPVAVVDRLFKVNGVPTPGDMHSISLKKIDEIIGPDAVLYIHIKEWTTNYLLIECSTRVALEYKLVHTRTGLVLWQRAGMFVLSSSEHAGGSAIVALVAAQVYAVASAATDGAHERQAAVHANAVAFNNPEFGLLRGLHHPAYAEDQERMRSLLAKEAQRHAAP